MSVSVRQAIELLELLAPHPEGIRVTQLAETMGVNKAIPHRLLQQLTELGYVEKDLETDRYRATYRLGALGLRQLESAGVRQWAQRHLDDLAAKTQELVRLAVVVDKGLMWIGRAQGSNSALILDPASGADVTLHATANGKAYLSTFSSQELKEVLGDGPLDRLTPNTVTDVALLTEEIDEARSSGYAIVEEEIDVGISAVAVPIVTAPGAHAEGTVSVAGPSARLTVDRLRSFVPHLTETAAILAQEWPVYQHITSTRSGSAAGK